VAGIESEREVGNPVAFPRLSDAQLVRLDRIAPARFRRLMAEDPELSDILLEAFRARREVLRQNRASRGLELVGSAMDSASRALRTYAARQRLPHLWFEADSVAGQSLIEAASLTSADLPAALMPDRVLSRTTRASSRKRSGSRTGEATQAARST
jgi:thioredoxin reductase (NADPH)